MEMEVIQRQRREISTVRIEAIPHSEANYYVARNAYASIFKRGIDIIVSVVLLLSILSWLTPLLYLAIRLGSRGPLFFVQKRIGLGGRHFPCIKFRTMRVNDACHFVQARTDDERITKIGSFLRATHIDELPQLINVLLNHMSIIGPRPHMLYHELLFSDMLPEYKNRRLVKPGITGLAQSAGYYGATPDFLSISGRTRLDLFYVQHISPGLDLRIFATTLMMVPAKLIKRSEAL